MKVLIVYAHPEPLSFNGAMFRQAVAALTAAGHEVRTSDLYELSFNAVSGRSNFKGAKNDSFFKQQLEELQASADGTFAADIATEQEKLLWCDLMIWQFPLWWFSVPGILKGWVDRVFAMGTAYGQGRIYEQGVFTGKKALLSLTTGSPPEAYLPDGLQGDMAGILRPLQRGILEFTGFSVLAPQVVYGPARITEADRAAELVRWSERLQQIDEEQAITVGRY